MTLCNNQWNTVDIQSGLSGMIARSGTTDCSDGRSEEAESNPASCNPAFHFM